MSFIYTFIKKSYFTLKLIFELIGKIFYLASNNNKEISDNYMNIIEIHCIEKGLGMPNVRLGFGKAHIKNIIDFLIKSKNKDSYNYKYSLSILKSYIDFHKQNNYDVTDIESFYEKINPNDERFFKTGTEINVRKIEHENFKDFILSRHSIRNFKDELVNEEVLKEAFLMNQTVPSACNRQTTKVYYSMDNDINKQLGELFPGNNGFRECVNQYLIITGDIAAFRYNEYGQWYTNVGIYAYGLALCLYSLGVDSCMLQWTSNKQKENKLRSLLSIPKNEDIVLSLAIGYAKDDAKILISKRKDIEEVTRNVDNIITK